MVHYAEEHRQPAQITSELREGLDAEQRAELVEWQERVALAEARLDTSALR